MANRGLVKTKSESLQASPTIPMWERDSEEDPDAYDMFVEYCYTAQKGETPYDYIKRVHSGDMQVCNWAVDWNWADRRERRLEHDHIISTKLAQTEVAQAIQKAVPVVQSAFDDAAVRLSRLRRAGANNGDVAYDSALEAITKLAKTLSSFGAALGKNVINVNTQAVNLTNNPHPQAVFSDEWNRMPKEPAAVVIDV